MATVFISHSATAKPLADQFVDRILRLGCELSPRQIFYSSRLDTGVASGADLNWHVRNQVADATVVIALLTPAFQNRPFCLAELGAAWARSDLLFPIAIPGMSRAAMQGVLGSLAIRYLDDPEALDELHERVCAAANTSPRAVTWNYYKQAWLTHLPQLVSDLTDEREYQSGRNRIASMHARRGSHQHLEVFEVRDGELRHRWHTDGWSDWHVMELPDKARPIDLAAASHAGYVDLAIVTESMHLYHRWWGPHEGEGWSGWADWGAAEPPLTLASSGPDHMELFVYRDGRLTHRWLTGNIWSEWELF